MEHALGTYSNLAMILGRNKAFRVVAWQIQKMRSKFTQYSLGARLSGYCFTDLIVQPTLWNPEESKLDLDVCQLLPVPPYLSAMLISMSDFKLSMVLRTSSLPFPAAHINDVLPSRSESSFTEGCFKNTLTVSCKKTSLKKLRRQGSIFMVTKNLLYGTLGKKQSIFPCFCIK